MEQDMELTPVPEAAPAKETLLYRLWKSTRGTIKRIGASDGVQRMLHAVIASYIRFVYWTGRFEFDTKSIENFDAAGQSIVGCFWHGRIMMIPFTLKKSEEKARLGAIVSKHRDGQLIAGALERLGLLIIEGSTGRGGIAAALNACKLLKSTHLLLGIAADGPRGPLHKMSDGAAFLALKAGAPIIPIAFSAKRRIMLKTWDNFMLALPFTKGIIMTGEPLYIPEDADKQERMRLRDLIEQRINEITAAADAKVKELK